MESKYSQLDGPACAHLVNAAPRPPGAALSHRQLAYCECGARLTGDSIQGLLDAAERHFVQHRHSSLFGATLGADRVAH